MTLEMIKQILSNRLTNLNSQKAYLVAIGDLEQVTKVDLEITETQATLDQLSGL
jgi:hypothetical protein